MLPADLKAFYEAYNQIHSKEEVQEAVYGGEPKKPEAPKDTRMTVTAADKKANTPAYRAFKAGDKRYKAAGHLGEESKESKVESDLFDQVLEFLVAEGYADTNQEALELMAKMNDDERNEIIHEAKYGTAGGRKALAKKIRKGEEVGKSGTGTGFKAVEKQAKKYGVRDPKAVAAAAMWKTYGK